MKILIVGGTGFIGKRLIKYASEKGDELVVIGKKARKWPIPNGTYLDVDILDSKRLLSLQPLLCDVDRVIYLASAMPYVGAIHDDPVLMVNVNVLGLCNFLQLVPAIKNLKKICYASTIDVYGKVKHLPIDESHLTNPLTYYGITKLTAEMLLKKYCEHYNLHWMILRLSHVYGPGDNSNKLVNKVIDRIINGRSPQIFGDGSDLRDLLYVDDAANALLVLTKNNVSGIYNVATGRAYCLKEIISKIVKLSGKNLEPVQRPRVKEKIDCKFNTGRLNNILKFYPECGLIEGLQNTINWRQEIAKNKKIVGKEDV